MLFILQFSLISESDYLMKLLVTGASGNIGTVLKSKLQENDIPFIGVDITNQNSSNNNFFQLDITNENELQEKKSVFDNIDTLIHLASKIDAGADVTNTGIESVNVNIKGTLNLLEHLPNLKNILFPSTYMVYGIPQQTIGSWEEDLTAAIELGVPSITTVSTFLVEVRVLNTPAFFA